MAAFDPAILDRWRALAIVDRDGTTVGTISEFYLDRETGHPTWALVTTGLFGASQTFVPLIHATEISDGLQVPYEKSHIKNTPKVDLHDELTPQEEAELFAHYGVEYSPSADVAPAEPELGSAGYATVAGDEGPGPVRAEAGTAASPRDAQDGPGSDERPAAADGGGGESLGAVPEEPGSVNRPDPLVTDPAPGTTTGPGPAGSGSDRRPEPGPWPDAVTDAVPDEPGTADPEHTPRADAEQTGDSERSGSDAGGSADLGSDRFRSERFRSDAEHTRSQASDHDPNLARTAPVEPGLPGSTAASPYGPTPTVDKATHRSNPSAEQPLRVSDETDWPPGAAGSYEEQEPFDRPTGTSDRWREAKLAAERDRIARAAAARPEERSPLERARRRLERLVGGGQDDPDSDEVSPADREAAERARRARLGLDDDDHRRR
ncbi:MAG TPA: PRC-barrel domain-containing protein [Actinomycetes bacterium]|nr:PRC-barrel domain-containing protein [Actinomycetes bacterium]